MKPIPLDQAVFFFEKVKETVGDCPFEVIGKVSQESLKIDANGERAVSTRIGELEFAWKISLEKQIEVT